MEQRAATIDHLENAREGAVEVLTRVAAISSNNDAAHTQMLTHATKTLTETVNDLEKLEKFGEILGEHFDRISLPRTTVATRVRRRTPTNPLHSRHRRSSKLAAQ